MKIILLKKKKYRKKILQIINDETDLQANIQDFYQILQNQHIFENCNEFKIILTLILKIFNNHRRTPTFFNKFEQILLKIKNEIKQSLLNSEIFQIFSNNKRLLLFLFKENIIIPDDSIYQILSEKKFRRKNYLIYLFNEFKLFFDDELLSQTKEKIKVSLNLDVDDEIFYQKFEKCRIEGENNGLICEHIRNDSIEEFIINHEKTNFSLSSTVNSSIFETNTFLMKGRPSLIVYELS